MHIGLCLLQALRSRLPGKAEGFQELLHRIRCLPDLLTVLVIFPAAPFPFLRHTPIQMAITLNSFPQLFDETIIIAFTGIEFLKGLLQGRLYLLQPGLRLSALLCPFGIPPGQIQIALPVRQQCSQLFFRV